MTPKPTGRPGQRRRTNHRLHHPPGHALRRHLHGARAGASAGATASRPPNSGPGSSLSRPSQRKVRPRTDRLAKDKTGVFTGAFAINPVNDERIPIWIADYVLMGYGTGAIMAVPAHDERDLEFARKFGLPIREVVMPPTRRSTHWLHRRRLRDQLRAARRPADPGGETQDHRLAGRTGPRPKHDQLQTARLALSPGSVTGASLSRSFGSRKTANIAPALENRELPRRAAATGRFQADRHRPNRRWPSATDWVRYSEMATRETNTMPQWAGSCWYYLRYCDPTERRALCRQGSRALLDG